MVKEQWRIGTNVMDRCVSFDINKNNIAGNRTKKLRKIEKYLINEYKAELGIDFCKIIIPEIRDKSLISKFFLEALNMIKHESFKKRRIYNSPYLYVIILRLIGNNWKNILESMFTTWYYITSETSSFLEKLLKKKGYQHADKVVLDLKKQLKDKKFTAREGLAFLYIVEKVLEENNIDVLKLEEELLYWILQITKKNEDDNNKLSIDQAKEFFFIGQLEYLLGGKIDDSMIDFAKCQDFSDHPGYLDLESSLGEQEAKNKPNCSFYAAREYWQKVRITEVEPLRKRSANMEGHRSKKYKWHVRLEPLWHAIYSREPRPEILSVESLQRTTTDINEIGTLPVATLNRKDQNAAALAANYCGWIGFYINRKYG